PPHQSASLPPSPSTPPTPGRTRQSTENTRYEAAFSQLADVLAKNASTELTERTDTVSPFWDHMDTAVRQILTHSAERHRTDAAFLLWKVRQYAMTEFQGYIQERDATPPNFELVDNNLPPPAPLKTRTPQHQTQQTAQP